MKLLNALQIMACIHKARRLNEKGLLKHSIKNITVPEFWICPENPSIIKKQILIQMAINNEPKPNKKHPLRYSLHNYIYTNAHSYDPIFTNKLKAIAPHWFINQSDIANQKKQQIIKLAQSNQPKPSSRHSKFGKLLQSYTNNTYSSFDPVFTKQIKSLAPHWFINKVDKKKQLLLQMAKSKQPKPKQRKHPLGKILVSYTYKSHLSYDPLFTKQIKSLAPHWFYNPTKEANKKRQKLINMAKKGKPRPLRSTPLGRDLNNYLANPLFKKQIKSLNPNWFQK